MLAGALYGTHKRFTRWFRGRSNLSAGLICFLVVVALLLPLTGFTAFLITEAMDGARFVSETLRKEGVEGLLEHVPGPVRSLTEKLMSRFSVGELQLEDTLQEQVSTQDAGEVLVG